MRYAWAMLTVLSWGLWFGGMAGLILFVSYLFKNDRSTAVVAAPRMFAAFELFQFAVGAIAVVAAALWRMVSPGRTAISAIFLLLALSAIGAMLTASQIRRPMERLRLEGQSGSAEFQRLHKLSERVYSAQAMSLLAAGVMLPVAMSPARSRQPTRTMPEAARPTTPPAEPADQVQSP